MTSLNSLSATRVGSETKRRGRGYGSGKGGHTTGRGAKGHKARGKVKLAFAGTKIKKSWLKRLPLWRGKGGLKGNQKATIFNLDQLGKHFQEGEKVDPFSLFKKGLIRKKGEKVKVVNKGKLEKKLIVDLPATKAARRKIIRAGGKGGK